MQQWNGLVQVIADFIEIMVSKAHEKITNAAQAP
jgi:hypothetical protein